MLRDCLFCLLLLGWMPAAQAVPAFSRQTDAACNFCHFQDVPTLNANGRAFLRNAFHETPEMRRQLHELRVKKKRNQHHTKPGAGDGH